MDVTHWKFTTQMSGPVSGKTKLLLGVILPVSIFLVYHALLLLSVSGKGEDVSFAGMALLFRSIIIVPAVLAANALLMRPQWKRKRSIVVVGLVSPAIAGIYEYVSLYGHP